MPACRDMATGVFLLALPPRVDFVTDQSTNHQSYLEPSTGVPLLNWIRPIRVPAAILSWMTNGTLVAVWTLLVASGCGGGSSEHTGQGCTPTPDAAAGTCFSSLQLSLKGAAVCLTQVSGGYCTHLCQADGDCCAVPGECTTSFPQVCAPFESTGQSYCFLSCEDAVVPTGTDSTVFCQQNANATFLCRSTGGGSQNKKVCIPNG